MSGDKKNTGKVKEIQVSGKVITRKISAGSKSEKEAVILQTAGKEYVLRKIGGNPFYDASLQVFVGKIVIVTGMADQNLFLAKEIKVI